MKQLVFVHGRAQENKDAVALKAEWVDAFRHGLERAGLTIPIGEQAIRFPYYGQTLYDLVRDVAPDKVAEIIVRGTTSDEEELAFMRSVIGEVARETDISEADIAAVATHDVVERGVLNWPWVQQALVAIDRHVPFASGASIALATHDVYQYLYSIGIRDHIEVGVRQALTPNVPTVVVAHSLGTVVAYSLLRREGKANKWNVPLLVTLGSPLGVSAIRKNLAPNKHPECVGRWFNAMDERDVVALYPLDDNHFPIKPPIENKTDIDNDTENRHGISGYLSDPEVARRIYDALTG